MDTNRQFESDLKNQFTVVGSEEAVRSIWGVGGLSNTMLVKIKNNVDSNKFIKNFNNYL